MSVSRIAERLLGLSALAAGSVLAVSSGVPAFVILLLIGALTMLRDAIKSHNQER